MLSYTCHYFSTLPAQYILTQKYVYIYLDVLCCDKCFSGHSEIHDAPRLSLSTATGGSSHESAVQGANTDSAVNVSMRLTPSGYLTWLTSGSMLPMSRSCCQHQEGLLLSLCPDIPPVPNKSHGPVIPSSCLLLARNPQAPDCYAPFFYQTCICVPVAKAGVYPRTAVRQPCIPASLLLGLEVRHAALLLQFLCPWKKKHGSR